MSGWNRTLALVGCTLIAAACTQDTTTAPPVAAEVGIEALPTAPGAEAGKITLVAAADPTYCVVKVAFTKLYDVATNDYDMYFLKLTTPSAGWYQSPMLVPSRRGTYRGTLDYTINATAWTSATEMWLGYWDGGFASHTHIADMAAGVLSNLNANFTIVDRCH